MDIFEQFGINEIVNATLYSIHKKKDGSGELYCVPALFLDTLRISSFSKSADSSWAEGGNGNSRFICWDYSQQINVSLEDALCTPASLSLCWGGVLNADWKDTEIGVDFGSLSDYSSLEKIERTEEVFYLQENNKTTVIEMLPRRSFDDFYKSSFINDILISGIGYHQDRSYKWNMKIETEYSSIFVIPEKFFDIFGNTYLIKEKITQKFCTVPYDIQFEVIYSYEPSTIYNEVAAEPSTAIINENKYLKIVVNNKDEYKAFVGKEIYGNFIEVKEIDTYLFKGLDMWNKFKGLNELIYFLITKYKDNITYIPKQENLFKEKNEINSQLWAYVNPKTMRPYPDNYWFNFNEKFYIHSLTLVSNRETPITRRIQVNAGQFPGVYMFIGETKIRNRETLQDEKIQIKIPVCKVKTNQNIDISAGGDPTIINLNLEVAVPENGVTMELTVFDTETRVNNSGYKDGSTQVLRKGVT